MSRLEEYTDGAVSTESVVDEVKVNKEFLTQMIKMHIASGNVLDQIKKHAFYRREYNTELLDDYLLSIHEALKTICVIDPLAKEEVIDINPRIFHAMLGASTEAVELLEALNFDGEEMDLVNIGEEFGDLNWYQAIFCDAAGIMWDDILDTNAEKLFKSNKARYKDGFTDEKANERNLTAERDVLNKLKIETL